MKQSVSTTTTLKMALVFTLLFSAFLAVAITYNKAFRMKNEALAIIEKYDGITDNSLDILNKYLLNNGYNTKGKCEVGDRGITDLHSTVLSNVSGSEGNQYFYCLNSRCTESHCKSNSRNKIYYTFKLFFNFDMPMFSNLTTFRVNGETKAILINTKLKTLK